MFERKKQAGKIYFLPIDQIRPSPFQVIAEDGGDGGHLCQLTGAQPPLPCHQLDSDSIPQKRR